MWLLTPLRETTVDSTSSTGPELTISSQAWRQRYNRCSEIPRDGSSVYSLLYRHGALCQTIPSGRSLQLFCLVWMDRLHGRSLNLGRACRSFPAYCIRTRGRAWEEMICELSQARPFRVSWAPVPGTASRRGLGSDAEHKVQATTVTH